MKILSVAMTLIFLTGAADYCCAGGIVKSVQYVEVVLANGVFSNSVTLSKNQTLAQCVPFVTQNIATNGSGCNLDDWFIDVYLQTGPKVTIQRTGNSGTVTAGISVVEFDPDSVMVQSGTFSIGNTSTQTTANLSYPVNTNKAALVFYSKAWSAEEGQEDLVRGGFKPNTNGTLIFDRWAPKGANPSGPAGHYYVFEALGNQFSVQSKTHIWNSGASTNIPLTSSVTTGKTFLIVSYKASSVNAAANTVRFWLNSASQVRGLKNVVNGAIYSSIFAVSFANTGSDLVQRGSWSTMSGRQTATLTTAVNTNYSTAWNPTLPPGMLQGCAFNPGQGSGARQKLRLLDSTTIESTRYPNGASLSASWEVIEWSEYVIKNGPVILID